MLVVDLQNLSTRLLRNNPNQPQVQQVWPMLCMDTDILSFFRSTLSLICPHIQVVELAPEPTVDQAVSSTSGTSLSVSCVFGSCLLTNWPVLDRICQEFNFEFISVSQLIKSAQERWV
jgi:hypothetical protein